jgi:hypothetical protein
MISELRNVKEKKQKKKSEHVGSGRGYYNDCMRDMIYSKEELAEMG